MNQKRRTFAITLLILLFLLVAPIWITYREYKQARLDHALIEAIKAGNEQKALEMLAEGADGGARDTGHVEPVSMGELLLRLFKREPQQVDGEKHLAAIVLLYQRDYGRDSVSSALIAEFYEFAVNMRLYHKNANGKPDPELVKALLDHGANLNDQDKDEDRAVLRITRI